MIRFRLDKNYSLKIKKYKSGNFRTCVHIYCCDSANKNIQSSMKEHTFQISLNKADQMYPINLLIRVDIFTGPFTGNTAFLKKL